MKLKHLIKLAIFFAAFCVHPMHGKASKTIAKSFINTKISEQCYQKTKPCSLGKILLKSSSILHKVQCYENRLRVFETENEVQNPKELLFPPKKNNSNPSLSPRIIRPRIHQVRHKGYKSADRPLQHFLTFNRC